eukprot:TRINITY_DN11701_c0_g1_i1.p2 TRINITY_DN11701_c0_g1~~TRINITY_DN11701_c0_g1_i1.p2  ORF type:complete len:110 (+),score=19.85 TRINITY_DN11701_c0_g1_i1:262-591(+)
MANLSNYAMQTKPAALYRLQEAINNLQEVELVVAMIPFVAETPAARTQPISVVPRWVILVPPVVRSTQLAVEDNVVVLEQHVVEEGIVAQQVQTLLVAQVLVLGALCVV